MVRWPAVKLRFADVQPWIAHAGAGHWNDLDSVNVGNSGAIDALSACEKRSYATLWAISAAPFYTGSDLTKLDALGTQLLTNPEVLAVNQRGRPARPTNATKTSEQQVRTLHFSAVLVVISNSLPAFLTLYMRVCATGVVRVDRRRRSLGRGAVQSRGRRTAAQRHGAL